MPQLAEYSRRYYNSVTKPAREEFRRKQRREEFLQVIELRMEHLEDFPKLQRQYKAVYNDLKAAW